VRVLCAEPRDMSTGAARNVLRGQTISPANELCLYRTLVSALEGLLAKYPTTLAHDEELLRRRDALTLSRNARSALVLRRGEKRLLLFGISKYKRLLRRHEAAEGGGDDEDGGDARGAGTGRGKATRKRRRRAREEM
jgi:hypothetical protein